MRRLNETKLCENDARSFEEFRLAPQVGYQRSIFVSEISFLKETPAGFIRSFDLPPTTSLCHPLFRPVGNLTAAPYGDTFIFLSTDAETVLH